MRKSNANNKITVIVPICNVESYLEECLLSLTHQSTPFDEIILINDGSTDNSLRICERYAVTNSSIKLINQSNKGLSVARNVGIGNAKSDYVLFLDSDDCLVSDACRVLKQLIQDTDLEVICFDADIFGDVEGKNKRYYDRSSANIGCTSFSGLDFFYKIYPTHYVVSACLALYKKSMISEKSLSFPEKLYYEDNYFFFTVLCNANKVTYIADKLYRRRYRENSITTSIWTVKKFHDRNQIVLLIYKYIFKIEKSRFIGYQDLLLRYISSIFYSNLLLRESLYKDKIIQAYESKSILDETVNLYYELLNYFAYDCYSMGLEVVLTVTQCMRLLEQYKMRPTEQNVSICLGDALNVLKKKYIDMLVKIPFDKQDVKVGVYGTGKHTAGLLKMYEKLIGQINCELVFIDSTKTDGCWHERKIVNYQCLDESYDGIVIASYLYRNEMLSNLETLKLNMNIIDYNRDLHEDIFSQSRDIMLLF